MQYLIADMAYGLRALSEYKKNNKNNNHKHNGPLFQQTTDYLMKLINLKAAKLHMKAMARDL